MWKSSSLDLVAIGDTTIDAFIKLQDAKVHCNIRNEDCELCVRFGQKVPYESVVVVPAVGNSANAAVSGARLGLRTGLIAVVGDDQNGQDCLLHLKKEKVDTAYMRIQRDTPTNYHYVLRYESERTILIKHQAYAYTLPEKFEEPKWLYLSSLGESTLAFHNEIAAYVQAHPNVRLVFQPGTFQMAMGYEKLRDIYARTEVFFCNKEEAQSITGRNSDNILELLAAVRTLGPKVAVITDGPKGAYASDGTNHFRIPIYPDRMPPVERTGAGDAFSSTTTAALILGLPLEKALLWGPVNSMSVVEHVGAQEGLLTREQLEALLAAAPAGYEVTNI